MNLIVENALRNNFVSKVLVSNSNRSVRIGEWIEVKDPRLVLVDETEVTQPGHRFVLADRERGEYFLSVDDDIFLTPDQWGTLFERLVLGDAVPHGIRGNLYKSETDGSQFDRDVAGEEREVDVLVGAYAFTREHLARMFVLALRIGDPALVRTGNGQDILLSFAGSGRPRIQIVWDASCASPVPRCRAWPCGRPSITSFRERGRGCLTGCGKRGKR